MRMVACLLLGLLVTGCGSGTDDGTESEAPTTLALTSPAFADGETIPPEHTCDGDDVPPPLTWSVPADVAERAASLALVVVDPDAPGGTFAHWVVAGLPVTSTGIDGDLPAGATEGPNGFGDAAYGGPCPPPGDDPHRYEFTLVARSAPVNGEPTIEAIRAEDAVIATGHLAATYGR